MKVLCFGNEFVGPDSLAIRVADGVRIKGVEFVKCANPDELGENIEGGRLVIIDVAKGIKKVSLIRDVNKVSFRASCSCHDLDLGFHLKLLKALGRLDEILVIALPMGAELKDIEAQLRRIFSGAALGAKADAGVPCDTMRSASSAGAKRAKHASPRRCRGSVSSRRCRGRMP